MHASRAGMMRPEYVWVAAVILAQVSPAAAQGCPNVAGVAVGSVLCTLAVVGLIIGVILLLRWKKNKKKKPAEDGGPLTPVKSHRPADVEGHENPAFQDDSPTGPTGTAGRATVTTSTANDPSSAEKGFSGYVPYRPTNLKELPPARVHNGNVKRSWSPKASSRVHTPGFNQHPIHKTGSHGSLDDSFPAVAAYCSAIELSKMCKLPDGGESHKDPEVISVALQSQDIIGLGFNICGNLRDGIFVSQVHNRGPASESGLIKPGDRILGITISFENMVYEDALTILSYASPYPVRLLVQKKVQEEDAAVSGDADYEEALHLHHPVYRSQSMDDVSKIAQDSVFRVQRARSEMKRGSSKSRKAEEERLEKEGQLRKWSGKPDFGGPVATTDGTSDEKSEDSTVSIPDLRIDASDLMMDPREELTTATVHHQPDITIPQSGQSVVTVDEIHMAQTEAPTLGISPKRQGELDRKEGLRLSYEADQPPVPKLDLDDSAGIEVRTAHIGTDRKRKSDSHQRRDSASSHGSAASNSSAGVGKVRRISGNTMEEDVQISMQEPAPPGLAGHVVHDVTQEVSVQTKPAVAHVVRETGGFIDVDLADQSVDVGGLSAPPGPPPPPPTGPPPLLADLPGDAPEASMIVNLSGDSVLMRDEPSLRVESAVDPDLTADSQKLALEVESDDSVRAVLKDYFSDQPSLMERLGLSPEEQALEEQSLGGNVPDLSLEREGDAPDIAVRKVVTVSTTSPDGTVSTTTATTAHSSTATAELDPFDIQVRNRRPMEEVKQVIRRRSSSSEEEPGHASPPSSLSSRSSSPTPGHHTTDPTMEEDLAAMDLEVVAGHLEKKSLSPVVKKKSSGGLSYEISPTEFEDMKVETPVKERGDPQGGLAYYVNIGDQFNATTTSTPYRASMEGEPQHDDQPSLVKAWGLPSMGTTPVYELDTTHEDDQSSPVRKVTEVVTVEKVTRDDGSGSLVTETMTTTRSSTVNMDLSNNNNGFGVNGDGKTLSSVGSMSVGSPSKTIVTTREVSAPTELITVTPREEVKGAFTLTVNPSQNDDSEA